MVNKRTNLLSAKGRAGFTRLLDPTRRVKPALPLVALFLTALASSATAQLDATWTVTVRDETVRVNPDGTFRIANVAAPDEFGPGGPGTVPDFVSDEYLRVTGVSTAGGVTRFTFSERFRIEDDIKFVVDDMTITDAPPPFLARAIVVDANPDSLTLGESLQLAVTGLFPDGSMNDLTPSSMGTVYRSSNPSVAMVNEDGLLSSLLRGGVFVTATNDGATSVKRVDILSETVQTTIEGYVRLGDDSAVEGALVTSTAFGGIAETDANGFFVVLVDAPIDASATVAASANLVGIPHVGGSDTYTIVPDGITDVGIVVVAPQVAGPLFGSFIHDTGREPVSAASGDLDGDGDIDVVTGNEDADDASGIGYVRVFLNDGEGRFADPVSYRAEGPDGPRGITVGDLDLDGDLDIVTAEEGNTSVSVLLNDGKGAFGDPTVFAVSSWTRAAAIGDLNADGNPDLAVAIRSENTVSILLGDGKGAFTESGSFGAGRDLYDVVMGDLDADGDLDLLTANHQGQDVSVLLNNGDATFADEVRYDAGFSNWDVELADLNGDQALDAVVAATGFGGRVAVMFNIGDGTFGEATDYQAGFEPQTITLSDLDGDGDIDIAAGNGAIASYSVFTNNGDGTFATAADHATGACPYAIIAADFDGDGHKDLATANRHSDNMLVHFNDGHGKFDNTLYGVRQLPAAVAFADFNDDDIPDLAVANGAFGTSSVSVLIGNGGGFAEHVEYPTDREPRSMAVGDFNGDTKPDIVTANNRDDTLSVLLNTGDGALAEQVLYGIVGMSPLDVEAGDLDGDGDLDLAVSQYDNGGAADSSGEEIGIISVHRNNGDGTFADPIALLVGGDPRGIVIADFDGDSDLDLAVVNGDTNDISFLRNAGDANFAEHVTYTAGDRPTGIAAGDLDGDGDIDLAVTNAAGDDVSILLNSADGTFFPPQSVPVGRAPLALVARDLDGDGDLDLAVANSFGGSCSLLLNNGDGSFVVGATHGAADQPRAIAAEDIDGDGDLDLALTSQQGSSFGLDDAVQVLVNRRIP